MLMSKSKRVRFTETIRPLLTHSKEGNLDALFFQRAGNGFFCNFDIVCNLSIVIWDFSAVSRKANSFYLNQLELTLTFP